MTVLDTSIVVDAMSGDKRSAPALRAALESGERLLLPTLVLYEWLRGPRLPEEIIAQEGLFPREFILPFGPLEAAVSAKLYNSVSRPRGREVDLAIAAYAIVREAELWALNTADFKDVPGLRLTAGKWRGR